MAFAEILLNDRRPRVVGSFGSLLDLKAIPASVVKQSCDLVEIRLDLLIANSEPLDPSAWSHLLEIPLLFTARRSEEGGALPLPPAARVDLLRAASNSAAWIDVEVASIEEMSGFLAECTNREIPWIASHHDFERLPATEDLKKAAQRAKDAGAAVFKLAAKLHSTNDLARLANFQLNDHGIRVATMGMGALAPVSRLLCAQCGSLFNYGFLGKTATAPGQWDSALLKTAIDRLELF